MAGKIQFEEFVVFDGHSGWEKNGVTYRLACAAWLTETNNGDLLCTWLTGSDMEPANDNCAVYSRSVDGGVSWSEPEIIVPSAEDNGSALIYSNEGHLVALCARWPLKDCYTVWNYYRIESFDNGKTWSEEVPFKLMEGDGVSACIGQLVKNAHGKYICCGSTFVKRDLPLTAGSQRLAYAKTEKEAAEMAPRVKGEANPSKFGTHLHGCCAFKTNESLSSFEYLGGVSNRPLGLLEPTMIELKDGTLVMLMRAEWGGYLWRSESKDGGRTWCDAWQTDIPNPTTLAQLQRLPDGRIVLFHNACGGVIGESLGIKGRDRLSVWVSSDEMKSWYIKEDIMSGSYFSYPCGLVKKSGDLVMAYDLDRRQIRFVKLKIDD